MIDQAKQGYYIEKTQSNSTDEKVVFKLIDNMLNNNKASPLPTNSLGYAWVTCWQATPFVR